MSLAEYLEQKKRDHAMIAQRSVSPSHPRIAAERNRGPMGRSIANSAALGQFSHEEGMRQLAKMWEAVEAQSAAWDAETRRMIEQSAAEIAEIERFLAEGERATISSAAWTGRPPTREQAAAVKALAPEVRDKLADVIADSRINDPEVLGQLQTLHRVLADLADAADHEADFSEAYKRASSAVSGVVDAADASLWKVTSHPSLTLGILLIVAIFFGFTWAGIIGGGSLAAQSLKGTGGQEKAK